jgi:hypothetical protein
LQILTRQDQLLSTTGGVRSAKGLSSPPEGIPPQLMPSSPL